MENYIVENKNINIGILCYDLSPASAGIINKISKFDDFYIKIFPLFNSSCNYINKKKNISIYESSVFPKKISIRFNKKRIPEVHWINLRLNLVYKIVNTSDVISLIGLQGIPSLFTVIYAYFKKKPTISIVQMMLPHAENKRYKIIKLLKKIIFRYSRHIVAQSESTMITLDQIYHVPKNKITYIQWDGSGSEFLSHLNKYNYLSRSEIRKELKWPEEDIVILYVGSLFYLKGVDILIKAFSLISKDNNSFSLVIVGEKGDIVEDLINMTKLLNVEKKVNFLGRKNWDELAKIYLSSDIFILPSRKDVFPKVLVEAALAGLPLVTTDVCGGAGAIVKDGENGYVIKSNDPSDLANAIIRLKDENKRIIFGKKSKKIALELLHKENPQFYKNIILKALGQV
jgi:glycosyltransferase involved in cell wall biosynthesis